MCWWCDEPFKLRLLFVSLALCCVSQSTAWLPFCPVQDGKRLVVFFFLTGTVFFPQLSSFLCIPMEGTKLSLFTIFCFAECNLEPGDFHGFRLVALLWLSRAGKCFTVVFPGILRMV